MGDREVDVHVRVVPVEKFEVDLRAGGRGGFASVLLVEKTSGDWLYLGEHTDVLGGANHDHLAGVMDKFGVQVTEILAS